MTRGRGRLITLAAALAAVLLVYGIAIGAPPRAAKVKLPSEVDEAQTVVPYGSSKMLLVGGWEGMLARVDNRGSLDPSFGDGGILRIEAADVAVDRKGRILVAAGGASPADPTDSDAQVTRLLPDGRLDLSFGDAGIARIDFGGRYDYGSAIAVARDGRILVGGRKQTLQDNRGLTDGVPALGRLLPNGAPDRSFGREGIRILKGGWEGGVFDVHPTRDGGLVAMGEGYIGISIWRLTESGASVRRFGEGGVVDLENRGTGENEEWLIWTHEIGVLANGTIVAAATGRREGDGRNEPRVVVVGLNRNGRLDRSFGNRGWVFASIGRATFAETLTVLPRNVTVVGAEAHVRGGARHLGLLAFGPDGGPNRRFSGRAKMTVGLSRGDRVESIARQGKRIVVLAHDKSRGLWLVGVPGLG
jgi:uncharacterized delta-60 repeat protein